MRGRDYLGLSDEQYDALSEREQAVFAAIDVMRPWGEAVRMPGWRALYQAINQIGLDEWDRLYGEWRRACKEDVDAATDHWVEAIYLKLAGTALGERP